MAALRAMLIPVLILHLLLPRAWAVPNADSAAPSSRCLCAQADACSECPCCFEAPSDAPPPEPAPPPATPRGDWAPTSAPADLPFFDPIPRPRPSAVPDVAMFAPKCRLQALLGIWRI